ncbi:MAG: hypothetical protein OXG37_14890 [Actinomycetia bacterium]|nr:hypothetical protein [Actinomycetes bacterium]
MNFVRNMNPTLRGFLIIFAIAGVVTGLSLEPTLAVLFVLARIAFLLAIAFFLYLLWRERRDDIATWPTRSKGIFYGAVLLAIVNIALAFAVDYPSNGLEIVIFIAVLVAAGYSAWRIWRGQHTYGY